MDRPNKTFRIKRKHINIFYLFTFAVMLLVTPLIIIQTQQRTQTKSNAAPAECPYADTLLSSGSTGPAVSDLQTRLQNKGYSVGDPGADGKFGPLTEGAVRSFQTDQKKNDPAFLVDGIVGPQTWEALCGVNLPGGGGGGTDPDPNPGTGGDPAGNDSACVSPNKGGWCQHGASGPGNSCTVGGQAGTFESGLCLSDKAADYLCCVPNGSAPGQPPVHTPTCEEQTAETCTNTPPLQCHWTGSSCVGGPGGDCSTYGDSISCGNDPACSWSGGSPQNAICQNKSGGVTPPLTLSLSADLQGVGIGAGENSNPQNQTIPATVKIQSNSNGNIKAVASATDNLTYDRATGNYTNSNFKLGTVAPGSYQMVLQIDKHLDKQLATVSGSNTFVLGATTPIAPVPTQMQSGDIAPSPMGDNAVDTLDWSIVRDCQPGQPPGACINKKLADLNDDGIVDDKDLDIVKSSMGQSGYSFQTDEYKCEPDPTCADGKNSLQLCSLQCERKSQRS